MDRRLDFEPERLVTTFYTYPEPGPACSRTDEKAVFERFVDFVVGRLEQYPDLHIYHFAPYEPSALKRLMGRYATREEEIDLFLRAKLFVDLYAVVRQGLRASVESYSIKRLEALCGYVRSVDLKEANRALAKVQVGLELGDIALVGEAERSVVAGYNRDDCFATAALRDWLEERRTQLILQGSDIARPELSDGTASEAVSAWQERVDGLIARLTSDIPADALERTPEQHARWLLAQMLDWHRREK